MASTASFLMRPWTPLSAFVSRDNLIVLRPITTPSSRQQRPFCMVIAAQTGPCCPDASTSPRQPPSGTCWPRRCPTPVFWPTVRRAVFGRVGGAIRTGMAPERRSAALKGKGWSPCAARWKQSSLLWMEMGSVVSIHRAIEQVHANILYRYFALL